MIPSAPDSKKMIRIINVMFVLMFPLSGLISGKIGAADLPSQPSATTTIILESYPHGVLPTSDTGTPGPGGTATQDFSTVTSEPLATSTDAPEATLENSPTESPLHALHRRQRYPSPLRPNLQSQPAAKWKSIDRRSRSAPPLEVFRRSVGTLWSWMSLKALRGILSA